MRAHGQEFRIFAPQKRLDENRMVYSINKVFLEEYLVFPYSAHDDFLDAVSRIHDMNPRPPEIYNEADCYPEVFSDGV
jgi:phage terminase large subunit-like protein